jgi:hypothetical protein
MSEDMASDLLLFFHDRRYASVTRSKNRKYCCAAFSQE